MALLRLQAILSSWKRIGREILLREFPTYIGKKEALRMEEGLAWQTLTSSTLLYIRQAEF